MKDLKLCDSLMKCAEIGEHVKWSCICNWATLSQR